MHNRYKLYKSNKINRLPQKISKFKRPKWGLLKRYINRLFEKKDRLKNLFVLSNPTKVNMSVFNIKAVRRYHFIKRKTKNKIDLKFEGQQSFKELFKLYKKSKAYSRLLREIYFRPYYNLIILLRELNFFFSVYECKQAIYHKTVFLNGIEVRIIDDVFLNKGDFLEIKRDQSIKVSRNRDKLCCLPFIKTFIEVDYYSNAVLILKDYRDISDEDLYLLATDRVDPYFFKDN